MPYSHTGIPLSQKLEIKPFAAPCIQLENDILSEVSQRQKGDYQTIAHTSGIQTREKKTVSKKKRALMNSSTRPTRRDSKQYCGYQGEGGEKGYI